MIQWVRPREGVLQPFDADRICRSLFLVTQHLGRADAFLARELTDSVVHFLDSDASETTIDVADLRELIVKVVRELGQPQLARAFEQETTAVDAPVPGSAEGSVFPAELRAAATAGWLVLGGTEAPERLAAAVLPWPRTAEDLAPALRRLAGRAEMLVLDGPEYWLCAVEREPAWFLAQVRQALGDRQYDLVLNLHTPSAPPAVEALAPGPLFVASSAGPQPADLAVKLAEQARTAPGRLVWHLTPGTTDDPHLPSLATWTAAGSRIEFVFQRRRRGIHLAEGVDRQEPALLLRIGLRLARLLGPQGREPDVPTLLQKIGTLGRLALSAGVSKRAYLRRVAGAELSQGFLLDRARVQLVPMGLDVVVERMTGRALVAGGQALDLGRKILQCLRDVLRRDGQKVQLAGCIDDSPGGVLPAEDLPGLDLHDLRAEATRRIRAASLLQEISERGRLTLPLPRDPALAMGRLLGWLTQIRQGSEIDRVATIPEEVAT